MQAMPQYSTALGIRLPSRAQLARSGARPLAVLGTWSWLGPGNIGGRTRGLRDPPDDALHDVRGRRRGRRLEDDERGEHLGPAERLPAEPRRHDPGDGHRANPERDLRRHGRGLLQRRRRPRRRDHEDDRRRRDLGRLAATATSDFYYVNKILVSPNSRAASTRRRGPGSCAPRTAARRGRRSTPSATCRRRDRSRDPDRPVERTSSSPPTATSVQATIYRNADAGGSGAWSAVYTEATMGRTSLAIAPSNQNVVYALSASIETGDFNDGLLAVFRSTDGGASWTAAGQEHEPHEARTRSS